MALKSTPSAEAHWNPIRKALKPFPKEWGIKKTNVDYCMSLFEMMNSKQKEELRRRIDESVPGLRRGAGEL